MTPRTTKATAPTCEWCQLPEVPKRCVREADMCADVRTRARLAEAALAEARGLLERLLQELRCVRSTNSVGTDTVAAGFECPCAPCVAAEPCWPFLATHPVAAEPTGDTGLTDEVIDKCLEGAADVAREVGEQLKGTDSIPASVSSLRITSAEPTGTRNQCDGCQAGMPTFHSVPGGYEGEVMGCTRDRYRAEPTGESE